LTTVKTQTLLDVIDEALDTLRGAPTRRLVAWLREQYPNIVAQHSIELEDDGLEGLFRKRRKERRPEEEANTSRNLCFDFGLPVLELDSEISIPRDIHNPIFGGSNWKEADKATLDDIDGHILLLEAQATANLVKADNWRQVRQAAARYAKGNHKLTLGELRQIAKGEQLKS
jgi:hypothetical protein